MLLACAAPPGSGPRFDGRIAFQSERSGETAIRVIDGADGSTARLTKGFRDSSPDFHPTDDLLLFGSNRLNPDPTSCSAGAGCARDIYTMAADGTGVTRLGSQPSNGGPRWSPDGTRIAFVSERDGLNMRQAVANDGQSVAWKTGNPEIYVMDADGSNALRLAESPAIDEGPSWLPNGTQIGFTSARNDPNPAGCYPECQYEIYVVGADGANLTRITESPGRDVAPDWSPDGSRIAFVSTRDGAGLQIHVMDSDGRDPRRLTDAEANGPAWSPDGSQIAFSSMRDGNWEIYVMDADGGGLTRLTDDPAADTAPSWSR